MRTKQSTSFLAIGDLARRTGLSVSAIRFYEGKGLIEPFRNQGGHRRYLKADIRRLSFIMIAQKLGFSLCEIGQALASLPLKRAPTAKDWAHLSAAMRDDLNARITAMESLRDKLDGCIGCGCLSLDKCKLYNPDDEAARKGVGPRYLMGDKSEQ